MKLLKYQYLIRSRDLAVEAVDIVNSFFSKHRDIYHPIEYKDIVMPGCGQCEVLSETLAATKLNVDVYEQEIRSINIAEMLID